MDFSEFLREEEELDLITAALIEEGIIGGALRAAGGFGGNLVSQTGRGVYNLVKGAGRGVRGVGRVGLGAVQGATGGGSHAVKTLRAGAGDLMKGAGEILTGAAQTAGALSGVTPTIRAIQAANEKSFFTPTSNRRTGLQRALGLNSWDPEGDEKKDRDEAFKRLRVRYAQAEERGDRNLMRRIRAEMEKVDPEAYEALKAKGRAARSARANEKWKRIVGDARRPEDPGDFLGRLASEQ